MMDKLVVIGAGGHSKVIQDIVIASGRYSIYAILDDAISKTMVKEKVIYSNVNYIEELDLKNYFFVVAIGDNQVRKKLVEKLSISNERYATIIHPSAVISKSSKLGAGTVIMPNATINADSVIGSHSIINTHAVVEHDNVLNEFVHISPGSVLSGGVTVNKETHLGSGSIVIPGKEIGARSVIGAGAVVTKDIPDEVTAVGVPAKVIKE